MNSVRHQLLYGRWVLTIVLVLSAGTVFGSEPCDVLIARADSLAEAGNYRQAAEVGALALARAEEELGSTDTAFATIAERLGSFYLQTAEYENSESFHRQALSIRRTALGADHPLVARSLCALAALYRTKSDYPLAESLATESYNIRLRAYGRDHAETARSIRELAYIAKELEKPVKADSLLLRSLEILEHALGPDDPEIATLELNIGISCAMLGRIHETEAHFLRALSILEAHYGANHPRLGGALSNLGLLYGMRERLDEAVEVLKRALRIREESLGPDHPNLGFTLVNLGSNYAALGKDSLAEQCFLRALEIRERALAPTHRFVAFSVTNLAEFYRDRGRFEEELPLRLRALQIHRIRLGPDHPNVAGSLAGLAECQYALGSPGAGLDYAWEAYQIQRRHQLSQSRYAPEREVRMFWSGVRGAFRIYLTCLVESETRDPVMLVRAAEMILSLKGNVGDELRNRFDALRAGESEEIAALLDAARTISLGISDLFVRGQKDMDSSAYRAGLKRLSEEKAQLEIKLARSSDRFRREQDRENISAVRLSGLLPAGGRLIEFASYSHMSPGRTKWESRYVAVVLGSEGTPEIVPIGDAADIDSLISEYQHHMKQMAGHDYPPTESDTREYRRIASALYTAIWAPLEPFLTGTDLVFVAPDVELCLVSFAGLPTPDGSYLAEKYTFHYLSSGRDLIRLSESADLKNGLVAFGDPDFDATSAERQGLLSSTTNLPSSPGQATVRSIRSECSAFRDARLAALPGTRDEVNSVATQWADNGRGAAALYTGASASEEMFKSEAERYGTIHIATHGYYVSQECEPQVDVSRNSLLLSGLFMAGANTWHEQDETHRTEDGILTGEEVSMLDLEGAELVVLSACETGLGALAPGQGVFGLRRAFELAGARTIVSSLWRISDKSSASSVSRIHARGTRSIPETLRDLQLEELQRLRDQGDPDHPYGWAAFISQGAWR